MTPPARSVSGVIDVPDVDSIRREVDAGMPDWDEFAEMRAEVQACKKERLAKLGRRNWVRGLVGGGVGTFVAATVFVVRALLSAGASAEAGRVQTAQVQDSAARIRTLEIDLAAAQARLSFLLARIAPFGATTP